MAVRDDEPLGAAEIAVYLGISPSTVYQWKFRGHMPPHDFIVNGMEAWKKSTIRGFVFSDRGWTPTRIADRDRLWPQLRAEELTRGKPKNTWVADPDKMAKAVAKRRANQAARKAGKQPASKTVAKAAKPARAAKPASRPRKQP